MTSTVELPAPPTDLEQITREIGISRAFINENDLAENFVLPELRVSNGPNYVSARMESAKLVPIPLVAPQQVTFGSRVMITTPEGEEITYTLAGEDEADAESVLSVGFRP